jgi:molybdopterin-containing oxidoreductase family membrane subunit
MLVFWWTGLLPDFAMLRDRAITFNKKGYSILSFGWSGRAVNVLKKYLLLRG